jgi:hypothetical protein
MRRAPSAALGAGSGPRSGEKPPPVHNRPLLVDGLDADGIGFSALPVH